MVDRGSSVTLARQRRAIGERRQLGIGDVAAHGRHAAVGAELDALLRHMLQCLLDGSRHFFGRLDGIVGDIDDADLHVLALEQREKLKQSKEFLDSPLLLAKAAIRWHDGYVHIDPQTQTRYDIPPHSKNSPLPTWDSDVWPEWLAVRDSAAPETEGVWVDQWLAHDAAEWTRSGPGILWYEHDLFGRRVAEIADRPFFGPGADAGSRLIMERGDRGIVASIRSHGTGKNLQAFARNLVANPPSDAAAWEQLVGRSHRQGQLADEVTVEVYRHTAAMRDALSKARMYAAYIQDTMGGSQKLLRGQFLFDI